ncbi:hypothetical protein FISHEDRAFT_71739 [Fistulina hepatica ATCC 64428]|uniref:Uncharacterized protein n=1 Tax=Fistulina hepatica ATCC 64428 TaxID=1128425 RepID=A0A0D7AK41_9AGAR|nr:hypothetical protein FISHEDRAFT_71739 [Fistulina hepatica ATCC 64428]
MDDLLTVDFNDFCTFTARHWKEEVQSQKISEAELTAFTHQLQDELAEYMCKDNIYKSHVCHVIKECNSVDELYHGEFDLHLIAMLISTKPEIPLPGYGSQVIVASDHSKELLTETQVDMAKVLDSLATIVKAQGMVAGQQVSTVQSSHLAHAQNTSVLPTTLGVNNEHGSDLGEDDKENHLSLDTLPDDDSHWQNKDWLIQAMVEKAKEDGFVMGIDLIAWNKSSIADKSVNVQIIRRSAINCVVQLYSHATFAEYESFSRCWKAKAGSITIEQWDPKQVDAVNGDMTQLPTAVDQFGVCVWSPWEVSELTEEGVKPMVQPPAIQEPVQGKFPYDQSSDNEEEDDPPVDQPPVTLGVKVDK